MVDWFLKLRDIDGILWYTLGGTIAAPFVGAFLGGLVAKAKYDFTGRIECVSRAVLLLLALLFDLTWGVISLLAWLGICGESDSPAKTPEQEPHTQIIEKSVKKQTPAKKTPATRERLPIEDMW